MKSNLIKNDSHKIKICFIIFLFIMKVYKYKKNNIYSNNSKVLSERKIIDVLFVNGCEREPKNLPHSYRYRILYQIEQLNAGFLDTYEIYYLNLNPIIICDFRVIIFYLCPWTDNVGKAISLAKILKKKVLFDANDLVIDINYTYFGPYLKKDSFSEKILYDERVVGMKKTLVHCQGVITSTKALAKEMEKYVSEIFINRNVESEEMFKLSEYALKKKIKKKNKKEIIIGYFSDCISNNDDVEIIIPVLIKILQEFKNVNLLFLGDIELNKKLKKFQSKIKLKPLLKWDKLPELLAKVDINIVPIKENIFNDVKSESKWTEAALVKVPTVASNFGEFKQIIKNGKTGILCNTLEDWYISLKNLIIDQNLQKTIGENAFEVCKEKYNTITTGRIFSNYINSISNKHIGFILPSLEISGGIKVVLIHASYLQDQGWDVDLFVPETNIKLFEFQEHQLNVIGLNNTIVSAQYYILVATLYSTLNFVINYRKVKRRLYLIQSYETDFYSYGEILRSEAEKTYNVPFGIEYITISKWCQAWLWEKYKKQSRYAPNGINYDSFKEHRRNLNKSRIRILIEGDNSAYYKNVDESFKIVEKLDKNKYEIWYMSYKAKPKSWYRVDRFLNKVAFEKVSMVYEECDILIKSSLLDSFSFPPLEMMATGGYCIVLPTGGNVEYLINEENCLFYKQGDIDDAVHCIERLISDEVLQQHLYENGLITAKKRDWNSLKKEILSLYEE